MAIVSVLVALVLCSATIVAAAAESLPPTSAPHWIWATDERVAGQQAAFRTQIDVPPAIRSARLRCATEYCRSTVKLNGKPTCSIENYGPWIDLDVSKHLTPGPLEFVIEANSTDGPAAVAVELSWTTVDGARSTIQSGPSWQARLFNKTEPNAAWTPAVSIGRVADHLWGINSRPVATTPFDDYEQWRRALDGADATDPATFFLPPGFQVELLRAAAADEGSWVAVACDPRGRVVIAREDRGLLRMRLAEDRRSIEQVEIINDTLEECRGLLFAHGALYVNANNSKGLFRLRDTNGDNRFDEEKLLRELPGSPGHGRNQLALGPDGMVYSIHGDGVELPAEDYVDHTSPFREARRGEKSKEGFLMRTNADGTQWELVTAGLRNPFGIAFHPEQGEPFTYDADAEFDMGSAWYRPTRILHLVSGGDFGWRGVTGRWPPYYPDHADNALPVVDIGHGSPTAVQFGDRSSFPPQYRSALFILDWAYGRVIAVHLAPRGASYVAAGETFLQGRPLNVTGLDFGPDGAMYLVTGGRKTQSALYRVKYIGSPVAEPVKSRQEIAGEQFSARQRAVRRQLEAEHRPNDSAPIDAAWAYLADADPAIRYAARIAIEHQPLDQWQGRAIAEQDPEAAVTALMALGRADKPRLSAEILGRLNAMPINELPEGLRLCALQTYDQCLAKPDGLSRDIINATTQRLLRLIPPPDAATVFTSAGMGGPIVRPLCALLIRLNAPQGVPLALAQLRTAVRQEDRMHYLFILRNAKSGWDAAARVEYFKALAASSNARGGQGMPGFIASIRADAVASLNADELAVLGKLIEPPSGPDEEPLPSRPFVRQWRMDDLTSLLSTDISHRDLARGKRLYREGLCARCHRSHDDGQSFGPDLTSVTSRFSRRDILESILSPSNVIADSFRGTELITNDGRILVGRVVEAGDYRQSVLRVATDPLRPWQAVEVPKDQIEHYRESPISPMPEGLLNTMSSDEILDLLAYLERRGDQSFPATLETLPPCN